MDTALESALTQKAFRLYQLVSADQLSSAVIAIGAVRPDSEQAIARQSRGAKVTKVPGTVTGTKVEWWRYQDDNFLHSKCYVSLTDKAGAEHHISVGLIAKSAERLASLEEAFSSIELE